MTIVQTLYKNKRGTYHEKLIFLFVLSFVIANIVMMISDYVRTKIDKYKYQILNTLTDRWNIYKWADDEKYTKSIANCL